MRQFDYDENENQREDVNKFFNEDSPDYEPTDQEIEAMMEEEAREELQLKLMVRDLNHRAIRTAIRMCEKSFWYKFYSLDYRLKLIERAYFSVKLLEEEYFDEDEE